MNRQPDDPGNKPDETTRHWMNDTARQDRWLMHFLAVLAVALIVLLMMSFMAIAQILDDNHYSCNLYVNDVRVSWPRDMLDKYECEEMRKEMRAGDKTKAVIECRCKEGSRT